MDKKNHPSLEVLKKTQWSKEFEHLIRASETIAGIEEVFTLMSNRLVMGSFRYGLMEDQDYSRFDLLQNIKNKLAKFDKEQNLECLIDAANNCLLMYVHFTRLGCKAESLQIRKYYSVRHLKFIYTGWEETHNLDYIIILTIYIIQSYFIYKRLGYKLIATDDQDHAREIK